MRTLSEMRTSSSSQKMSFSEEGLTTNAGGAVSSRPPSMKRRKMRTGIKIKKVMRGGGEETERRRLSLT